MVSINRKIFFISVLLLLMIIPTSFAISDDEMLSADENGDRDILEIEEYDSLGAVDEEVLAASNDYYFDASLENDTGDGSINNPYKYLTADRIKGNANIHLANGEYNLNTYKTIEQVNIVGSDMAKTIIKYNGVAFRVNSYLTLTNVTLRDLSITNSGIVNLTNVIMSNGYGSGSDSYGNYYGGAVYTTNTNANAQVNVVNSTFNDNYAVYGGAIYMGAGYLSIIDSEFNNNQAYNFGGAIACENIVNITVSRSKFVRNIALNDAGGAIYIKSADKFRADNLEITDSTATFGGAIASLNVNVTLNHVNLYDNLASWDGGAIYHMYGQFTSSHGRFIGNSARNGGGIFIDNSTSVFMGGNAFANNTALMTGGAIFSILNTIQNAQSYYSFNTFENNAATIENNVYDTDSIDLNIGTGDYELYQLEDTIINTLPNYYSLITEGFTTAVKDQESSGNCWAFTAIAVLESCLKKITGIEFDLSEENMKNIMALYSDYGWDIDTNDGGYDPMPWGYLASWLGPVNEADDRFDDKSVISPMLDSILHIQNIVFLKRNSYTDNDEIKTAIMKYGAVGTSIYMDNYYLNNGKNYFCWNNYASNHAVTIVGWDDSYSREHFKFGSYAEGDGAWIVKNSWGPYWGENGYFYVSYYDNSFAKVGVDASAYTFILNDTIKFDKNYQYDISGRTDYLYSLNPDVWYKNKFTATDNEILYGVSTYFEKTTNWTVSIYVNNELKASKSGTSNPGYYTINLDDGIDLNMGDVFEVMFNTTSNDISAVPVSEHVSLNKLVYSENVSFISYDGANWFDLYDFASKYSTHTYNSQVACIKAFTVLHDLNTTLTLTVDYNGYNPVKITANIRDEHGNIVRNGVVTFILDGETVTVNVVNGKASITRNFEKGMNNVTAMYDGNSYLPSSDSTSFEILKDNVTLDVAISKYQNNITFTITASKSISKKVLIYVNGEEHSAKLVGGRIIYKLTGLDNDEYEIIIKLADENIYETNVINRTVTVDVKNTIILAEDFVTYQNSGEMYPLVLLDENANPIANKKLTINLNDRKINAITDDEGMALVEINLASGTYTLTVSFSDEDSYYGSSNSSEILVKNIINIALESNAYQNNVLVNITLSDSISGNITLSVNGRNQSVMIINGKGQANLTNLENGNYTIRAFMTDEYFTAEELRFSIEVKETQIITENIVCDCNLNYTVTLIDGDGNPLAGHEIEFKLGNVTYNAVTDEEGNAAVNLVLEKGTYAIEVSFKGENDLFASQNSSEITVKPLVTAKFVTSHYSNVVNVQVLFSKSIEGTAVISIDNRNFTGNVIDGQVIITDYNLAYGNHNVSVELVGDEYNFTKTSSTFNISIKRTQILAEDFNTTDFSNEEYTVTLIDEQGIPIEGQRIMFVVNDEISFIYTDENGKASIPINLNAGNYTLTAKYYIDLDAIDKYVESENSSRIIVKLNASISVSVHKNLRDVTVEFTCSKAIDENITVVINGENKTVELINGKASLNLDGLADGEYSINIDLGDEFQSEPVEYNFTIKVKNTRIIAEDFETYYESGHYYQIRLIDEDGIPVSHALISLTFDNSKMYISRTNDDGVLSVPINLKDGKYAVKIKFEGNESYVSAHADVNMTVATSIIFANYQYTLNSDYIASLVGNVSGKVVNISVDGVQYQIAAVGNAVSFNINLNPGTYSITITNPVTGEVKSQSINVLSRLSDNKNIVMYYGANSVYSVKVYDDNGHVVGAGENVVISIEGKNVNVKTNAKGIASLNLKQYKPKAYTVTVTYKGFKVSNKITIKPTLITKNKSVKKGKTVKFTAKLLSKTGKALKGKKITFKIKGKTYNAKTNKKGVATVKIKNLKRGTFKIITKYGKLKNTNKIKIKK